jgi:hypothetical protein
MTIADVENAVYQGGRFVIYTYCISIIVMTFRRSSPVTYIPPGHSRVAAGLHNSLLSFFAGWWGIPWGPIFTVGSFITNFGGGKDVTTDVLASVGVVRYASRPAPAATPA